MKRLKFNMLDMKRIHRKLTTRWRLKEYIRACWNPDALEGKAAQAGKAKTP